MSKIVILKRYDRQFRIPLYNYIGQYLENKGHTFEIVYGQPDRKEGKTIKDLIQGHKWGKKVSNRYFYFGNRSVCWQPVYKYVRGADLVIVQQGSRLLINYLLILRRRFRKTPLIAFWGHGRNFQAKSQGTFSERLKASYSNHVDFWFAYNNMSKKVMEERGFPPGKIVALQNTIDTKEEGLIYDGITEIEIDHLREKLNMTVDNIAGIYCGSLYPEKQLDFLIEALHRIKKKLPEFHFIIVGDGILRSQVMEWVKGQESWIHYVGGQYGKEKLQYFRLASFQAITGLVGLNIIDSFTTLTPLITTRNRLHSPEISYLENYKNGIITDNNLDAYEEAIINYLNDKEMQDTMMRGCEIAREEYTIENMATNFLDGIGTALGIKDL